MRCFLAIAAWTCAFTLTGLLAECVLPDQLPWVVREKVAYLSKHGNEYDLLFLGSSRVANHIIPSIFDRTAAEQGLTVKSFNAGVPGMFTPNDDYVLDRILQTKAAQVHWIVLELQPLQTRLPVADHDTMEYFYWHDWPRMWLLCQQLAGKSKRRRWREQVSETVELLPQLAGHAWLFVRRFTNLGRGDAELKRWLTHEPAAPLDPSVLGENHDGWSLTHRTKTLDDKQLARLDAEIEERRQKPPVRQDPDPATERAYTGMIAKIRRAGATPVLMIPPNAARGSYYYPSGELAKGILILDFCDPRKYPILFETRYRADASHLNPAGAEYFTRMLADQFAAAFYGKRATSRSGNDR